MDFTPSVAMILPIVGALVVLVVILLLAQGRARVLGSIGALLVMLSSVVNLIFQIVLSDLMDQVASSSLPPVLVLNSALQILLHGAGLILLGLAVAAGRGSSVQSA